MEFFLIFVIGIVIGSFLNVCIYRIPNEESIAYPPSHCGNCNSQLKPLDLIPIFSYIFLRGRCRYCKLKISIQYPIIELLNGVVYVLLYLKLGLTIEFVKLCVLVSLLIVIGIIDYKTKFVYRNTVIFGMVMGVIFISISSIMYKQNFYNYLLGAIIGFGVIFLIVILTRGMGEGDIEIALICGLFLGVQNIIVTLFLAFVIGGIVGIIILLLKLKGKKEEIAFGPYLAIGALIAMLFGNKIINLYLNMF
ncbi:prepilin peptidase [Inconstantimicrobium mannanitabidum]|uniref:Prepilin peptidase n=1 Tax=Inconstantimicrobium mannanitabidum TaxID=1604901 RepID=A0ACB5R6V4_9CLOT|nr:A24 family peptidase [Clostridium sp. TW13]GKX64836.1 prepilin peptidase [Clostridium sp. TW13]